MSSSHLQWLVVGLLFAGALAGLLKPTQAYECPVDNPSIPLTIGTLTLQVEIASTPQSIACGLSQRDTLTRGQGMLFIHPHPDHWSFWMRDTRMPLTLLYLDQNHRVSQIASLLPDQSEQRVYSNTPITHALEIHPQDHRQAAIGIGTPVNF